ncbi:hypothetical protein HanPSC8_Chr10g0442401 [Helianthus annuus]|nr:hypothetical protein HanPSC8_Chr10g0442401 [Helianthus annuus]
MNRGLPSSLLCRRRRQKSPSSLQPLPKLQHQSISCLSSSGSINQLFIFIIENFSDSSS